MPHVPSNARVFAGAVASLTGATAIAFSAWGVAAPSVARVWFFLGIAMLVHGGVLLSASHWGGGRTSGSLLVAYALTALGGVSHTAFVTGGAGAGHVSGVVTLTLLGLALLGAGSTLVTRLAPSSRTRRGPMGA